MMKILNLGRKGGKTVIVIVCGMHRSGTSAMAGLLHSNGITMGKERDFYPPPMRENPKGFYENVRFRRINDEILKRFDYRVKSFDPNIPVVHLIREEKLRDKMKSLIIEFNEEFPRWGWKDPRTSLTALTWFDVIEEMGLIGHVRCILMLRPLGEVEFSLKNRGNKERWEGQFRHLAMEYIIRFMEDVQLCRQSIPVFPVLFKDLVDNTASIAELLSIFVKRNIEDLSFIDKRIVRVHP